MPLLSHKTRVLVAMSGGVDSSVAAALLHEQGHEVFGVTLHLWDAEGDNKVGRCCAPEDREDARRTCDLLGVPHYVLDERDEFRRHVVDAFVRDNLEGRTPSPCVHCNQHVKLGRLAQLADRLGATHIATGHYARIAHDPCGRARLLRGRDTNKDQSYFLFGVPSAVLDRLVFPLGEMIKDEARAEAQRLALPNWNKPDSQELCFVPDGNVAGFIQREASGHAQSETLPRAGAAGRIVDGEGRELGRHGGIEGFTVGQRRGLRVPGPTPRYVLRVVPEAGEVVVGDERALYAEQLEALSASWTGEIGEAPLRAEVRIRYRHEPAPATVTPQGDRFSVRFDEPQRAVAPGQAAVVYRGDQVLGGGFIA
jgi:tRNA-specific 2-thiouridylase